MPTREQLDLFVEQARSSGYAPEDIVKFMTDQGWVASQPIAPVFQKRMELQESGAPVAFTNPVTPGGEVAGQIGAAYSLGEAGAANTLEDFFGIGEGIQKASGELNPLISQVPFVGQAASVLKGALGAAEREAPENSPAWRRELNRLAQESEVDYLRFGEGEHRKAKLFLTRAALDPLNAAPGVGFSGDILKIGNALGKSASRAIVKGIVSDDVWVRSFREGLSEEAVETAVNFSRDVYVHSAKAKAVKGAKGRIQDDLIKAAEAYDFDLGASPADAARIAHDTYSGKVTRLLAEYNDNLAKLEELFPEPPRELTYRVRPKDPGSMLDLSPDLQGTQSGMRGVEVLPPADQLPPLELKPLGQQWGGRSVMEYGTGPVRSGTPPAVETTAEFKRLSKLDQSLVTSQTPDALPPFYAERRKQVIESLQSNMPWQSDQMRPAMSRKRKVAEEVLTRALHRELAEVNMEYNALDAAINKGWVGDLEKIGRLDDFEKHALKEIEKFHQQFVDDFAKNGEEAVRRNAAESVARMSQRAIKSPTAPADETAEALGRLGEERARASIMSDAGVEAAEVYDRDNLFLRMAERVAGTFLGGEEGAVGEGLLRVAANRYKDPAVRATVKNFAKIIEKSEGDKSASLFRLHELRRQVSREVSRFAKDNGMSIEEAGKYLQLGEARRGKDLGIITDDRVRDAVAEAGAFIDELTNRFISEGLVHGRAAEVLKQNLGGYMHTSYAFTHAKDWAKQVHATQAWDDAFEWFRKNYPDMTEAQIQGHMLWMVDRRQAVKFGKGNRKAFRDLLPDNLPKQQLDELLKKKDIPPELQELFGINKDFMVDFDISAVKMIHDLEATALQRRILAEGLASGVLRNAEEAAPGATTGHIAPIVLDRISKDRKFFATPELASALGVFNERLNQHGAFEFIMMMNGLTKFGKIVPSPATQARNAVSLVPMLIQNGTLSSSLRPGTEAWKAARLASKMWKIKVVRGKTAAKLTKAEEEVVQLAHKYNLFGTGVVTGEQEIWAKQVGDWMQGRQSLSRPVVQKGKSALDTLRRNYQSVDDFGKFVSWQVTRKKFAKAYDLANPNDVKFLQEVYGTTNIDEAAAEYVKQTFQHFPRTAPIGKKLARFPLAGTFVSFPLEMARNLKNTTTYAAHEMKWFAKTGDPKHLVGAMNKLAGIVTAGSIFAGATKYTTAKFGVDEAAFQDLGQAPWAKGNDYAIADVQGTKISFYDAGFINPYKDVNNIINKAFLSGKPIHEGLYDAALEIEEILLSKEIGLGAVLTFASNREQQGGLISAAVGRDEGRRIANPQDENYWQEKTYKLLRDIAPGGLVSMERLAKAAGSGRGFGFAPKSRSAHDQSVAGEVLGLFGMPRLTTIDVADNFSFRVWDLAPDVDDMRAARNSDMRLESDPEGRAAVDMAYSDRWDEMQDQFISSIESAKKLKVPRHEIIKSLDSVKVKSAVKMRWVNGMKSDIRLAFGPPKIYREEN